MRADSKLNVVICWHMHQPEYRDLRTGEFKLPWTYLHALKDYSDMAAHFEANPEARAVVNFAPILLEQIDEYSAQVRGFLQEGIAIRDPLLATLADPALPVHPELQLLLIKDCLRAHKDRQIGRYPCFQRLAGMADWLCGNPDAMPYIQAQFLVDLIVWYHLAWTGEAVKRSNPQIQQLIEKGGGYTLHDRHELLAVIGEQLTSVISRYRRLAESGQVELSVTPYAHPIMPLLISIQSGLEAMPDAQLPLLDSYPGGRARVDWHLRKGLETFEHFFGFRPAGCWPSEGGISAATLQCLEQAGFRWTASGGNVLHNTLHRAGLTETNPHTPFRLNGGKIACFFRDDGLSDRIGFDYSSWHADDAVNDLLSHLDTIATVSPAGSVVSIIMDGENAWEYFPDNGFHFLSALYRRLVEHPGIEMTTFSRCLESDTAVGELPELVAGSWVYGTFSTWIGDGDKNRAWDMLGEAKKHFDAVVAQGRLDGAQLRRAERQLAVCEGSDWFWWFGDYNPKDTVSDFEQQFRMNLANLYQILGLEAPDYLAEVFTHGGGSPLMGGAMRPGTDKSRI